MFVESSESRSTTSIVLPVAPIAARISSAVRAGRRPCSVSREAIVPPVAMRRIFFMSVDLSFRVDVRKESLIK